MTSKVKGQGRKVTWSVWQLLVRKSSSISHRNIGKQVVHPLCDKAHQFQCQKVKGQGHQTD